MLNSQELSHFSNEYNNFGRSPQNIITSYELQYNVKFGVYFKKMYKYIKLGYFNLKKEMLYFKNKKMGNKMIIVENYLILEIISNFKMIMEMI